MQIVLLDDSVRPNTAYQCVRRCSVPCPIADVQMPGMGGPDRYHHSTSSYKITTCLEDGARERHFLRRPHRYLGKPIEQDDLLACVRSALTHALRWQEVKHDNEWQFRAVRR